MSDTQKLLIKDLEALQLLNLEIFPITTDFDIELFTEGSDSSIRFVAPGLSVVIQFPWWGDVKSEIRQWSLADIPSGSTDSPYWDTDQGWSVVIWQHGDLVYIAQGGDTDGEYDSWLSVPASLYRAEWNKAIRLAATADY